MIISIYFNSNSCLFISIDPSFHYILLIIDLILITFQSLFYILDVGDYITASEQSDTSSDSDSDSDDQSDSSASAHSTGRSSRKPNNDKKKLLKKYGFAQRHSGQSFDSETLGPVFQLLVDNGNLSSNSSHWFRPRLY